MVTESPVDDPDSSSDLSSSSSSSASFEFPSTRHRHSSSASRVKDLVQSLERSSSIELEAGRRSASPKKKSSLTTPMHPDSFFNSPPSQSPRLLPIPPVMQHHTGPAPPTYVSLVPIASHTTGPQFPYHHEVGYRSTTGPLPPPPFVLQPQPPSDPTKQTFVVRHNMGGLAGEDEQGVTDAKGKKRLLPYPPVLGEAQVFHPRPVRVGGESPASTLVKKLAPPELSPSTSTDSEGFQLPDTPAGDLSSDPVDILEPTMEELLDHQPFLSGVDAWEAMDMTDTMKKVVASDPVAQPVASESAPPLAVLPAMKSKARSMRVKPKPPRPSPGSERKAVEFGRKSGRKTLGAMFFNPNQSADDPFAFNDVDTSQSDHLIKGRAGLLSLFEPPSPQPAVQEEENQSFDILSSFDLPHATDSILLQRQLELDELEQVMSERESALSSRERSVSEREDTFLEREDSVIALEEKCTALQIQAEQVGMEKSQLVARALELDDRESALKEREEKIEEAERRIAERERDFDLREEALKTEHAELVFRNAAMESREELLKAKEASLQELTNKKDEFERQRKTSETSQGSISLPSPPLSRRPSSTADDDEFYSRASAALWPLPATFVKRCFNALVVPILGQQALPRESDAKSRPSSSGVNAGSTNARRRSSLGPGAQVSSRQANEITIPSHSPINFRGARGSYIVLMSIGVCAVVLTVLGRKTTGAFGRR